MRVELRMKQSFVAITSLLVFFAALAAAVQPSAAPPTQATTLSLGGVTYLHRWSKNGQNEYTPASDKDLGRWQDMITINVHEAVRNGDQLASLANSVVGNYQKHGQILRTDSKPRTPQRPAEHLIVALLGNGALLEAAFARVMLVDGVGVIVVRSHRVYGKDAAGPMGDWVKANGPSIENALMSWDRIPAPAALKQLPQSQ